MTYDLIIIGGGIVGIATAYQIKEKNPNLKVLLVEKEAQLCRHQTGNNSGVIHSGLYYKPGSLKATNCINGYQMLLDFCQKQDIPYDLCGKVVVATEDFQKPLLENLYKRGLENGLSQISKMSIEQLKEVEPHVQGVTALKVPYTGIIDYVAVAEKYAELFKQAGGEILLDTKALSISERSTKASVETTNGSFETNLVINCGGLYSDKIASQTSKDID